MFQLGASTLAEMQSSSLAVLTRLLSEINAAVLDEGILFTFIIC